MRLRESATGERRQPTHYAYSLFVLQVIKATDTFSLARERAWMFKRRSAATGPISMEVDNKPEHLYRDVGVRGILD
jgi:hypothetical protein